MVLFLVARLEALLLEAELPEDFHLVALARPPTHLVVIARYHLKLANETFQLNPLSSGMILTVESRPLGDSNGSRMWGNSSSTLVEVMRGKSLIPLRHTALVVPQ